MNLVVKCYCIIILKTSHSHQLLHFHKCLGAKRKESIYIYQTLLSKATYIAFKLQFYIYQLLLSLGIEPMILALLAPCSTIWATGKLKGIIKGVESIFCATISTKRNCKNNTFHTAYKSSITAAARNVLSHWILSLIKTIHWNMFIRTVPLRIIINLVMM